MRHDERRFYKGIPGFTRARESEVFDAAELSIYRWWWQFLRLSPVFWYAQHQGVLPTDPVLARVCAQAGNLRHGSFRRWWLEAGADLFVESKRPLQLRRIDETGVDQLYPAGKSMLVEVPLNVTTRTLVRQFRQLLALTHGDQRVDVLAHSTAQWRLFTKRYNFKALEHQYWCLIYRLLYPGIASWRIGDRLQISPGLNVRNINTLTWQSKNNPVTRLQSTVGRYIYKAQRAVRNAEQGSFPNFNPCSTVEMPFGQALNLHFMEVTNTKGPERSPWQEWLHEEFHSELVRRIKEKNRITGIAAVNHKVMLRLPKFIAGESDLLS